MVPGGNVYRWPIVTLFPARGLTIRTLDLLIVLINLTTKRLVFGHLPLIIKKWSEKRNQGNFNHFNLLALSISRPNFCIRLPRECLSFSIDRSLYCHWWPGPKKLLKLEKVSGTTQKKDKSNDNSNIISYLNCYAGKLIEQAPVLVMWKVHFRVRCLKFELC